MTDAQLLAPTGVVSVPADYTIPNAQTFVLKAAFANIDGSGTAAAYLPCIRILAPGGKVVAEFITDATVASGASAEVTWAPFLGRGGGSGSGSGIQFGVEPQSGTWLEIETTSTDPTNFRGIFITTTNGMQVQKATNAASVLPALECDVTSNVNHGLSNISASTTFTGTNGTNDVFGVAATVDGPGLTMYGLWTQCTNERTSGTGFALGVFGNGFSSGTASAGGGHFTADSLTGMGASVLMGVVGTSVYQGSNSPVYIGVGGIAAPLHATLGGNWFGTTTWPKAGKAVGGYFRCSTSDSVQLDGVIVEMDGGDTTVTSLFAGYYGGTLKFRVDTAGNVHIPAAASYLNDL